MFVLIVLLVANVLVRRVAPRWALRGMELITIYVMLSVASAVTSIHYLHHLVGAISFPFQFDALGRFGSSGPPRWATVRDPEALRGYFYGNTNLYEPAHYRPWLGPPLRLEPVRDRAGLGDAGVWC